MEDRSLSRIYKPTAYLLLILMLTFSIIEIKLFLYPITLGILFSYLLFPLSSFFEQKLKMPRILANLLSIIIAIGFMVGIFLIVSHQLKVMMQDMPGIKRKIYANFDSLTLFIESKVGVSAVKQKLFLKDFLTKLFDESRPMFAKAFTATTGTMVRVGLLPVYVFFMLYYRDKAYKFIMKITTNRNRETVRSVLHQISLVTKRYVGGVFIVVLILCVLNSLGLFIIGLKYAVFFGIVSAFCNFIPYFGTILGFSFPLMYALITGDGFSLSIGVIILFFIVQFTENNILTPNIVGDNVRLNPFIIILSLIIGAMIWGVPGMLVIVPLIAVFRIICENVDKLKPYAFLLGVEGTEKHALTFQKIKGMFRKKRKIYPGELYTKKNDVYKNKES